MHEFVTAARAVESGDEHPDITFKVDDQEVTAKFPSPGQYALLMAAMAGDFKTDAERAATIINFFMAVLDDDSRGYFTQRLMSRTDDFEIDNVIEILEWLTEEWSGNPTKSPSGSTPSSATAGEPSTDGASSTESTHSNSALAASAT